MNNPWLKRKEDRESHLITVRYKSDAAFKFATFDLNEDCDCEHVVEEIRLNRWWPNRRQGVFDAVIHKGVLVDLFSPANRIFSSSIYDINSYSDFEYGISSRYVLRMNRFFVTVDDRHCQKWLYGGSVSYPTGWDGDASGTVFGVRVGQ